MAEMCQLDVVRWLAICCMCLLLGFLVFCQRAQVLFVCSCYVGIYATLCVLSVLVLSCLVSCVCVIARVLLVSLRILLLCPTDLLGSVLPVIVPTLSHLR